jgi:hypothetical protein
MCVCIILQENMYLQLTSLFVDYGELGLCHIMIALLYDQYERLS